MLRNLFTKALWDQRRGILVWAIGLAAVGAGYAAFYPTLSTPEMRQFMDAYPREIMDAMGITDLTSPEGYLGGTTYGLLGPLMIIIFGAGLGGRAIAGEEEAGRLDAVLAHPVTRTSVVVQRALAMLVALAVSGVVLLAAMLALSGPADFAEIGAANLAAASAQLVLLGTFFGALALAVGAATGSRGLALGVVAILAVLSYFANNLGPSVEWLAWSQDVSPFHWYAGEEALRNGFQALNGLVLIGASAALVALGAVAFRGRDVAV
jgi:ABC-2 type transport system permease protein